MATLMETLKDIADRHDERMKTDPRYAMTVAYMQQASAPVERSRHYDRDGYCDNPARGY
ncbi:hypothetical protein FHW77_002888 [Agrobacterium sp. RC10-4-1]|uniref:hypothetical protein n=1 Tax=Agrobacterium sp. RC10-4-1 TaxID=2587039 RepID=UPI0015FB8A43|nr:hypothetical protein [Agrobacterium sp. RC10-4-1]MBA8799169.1 hypothetical protein [Agrobacterium sp. RC10-4-1]